MLKALVVFLGTLLMAVQSGFAADGSETTKPKEETLEQLELRLEQIDQELDGLARFTLRGGVGNIGWASKRFDNPEQPQWCRVQFSEEMEIDSIVLCPVIWNDSVGGPQADGLPEAFDIIIGTDEDLEGSVVASLSEKDKFLPRIAPLVIEIRPTKARWVKIQAKRLSPDARTGRYQFSLSEIMVFAGQRNVALNQAVKVSSNIGGWGVGGIYKKALVDGMTPFLMDASSGEESIAFKAFYNEGQRLSCVIDLGEKFPVDGIQLHTADSSEYVPQLVPDDFGIPPDLSVEGANRRNFSDAVPLLSFHKESVYHVGPILSWNLPETRCRFIRVSVPQGYETPGSGFMPFCVVLAEIEVLSEGKNVAEGKRPRVFNEGDAEFIAVNGLTDGRNHFGDILPIYEWMDQLARRHDLQVERPSVVAALKIGYDEQKTRLAWMSRLAVFLAAGIVFIFLLGRLIRMRAMAKLKERIAADMHDELGANLHTIGLLSDSAKVSRGSDGEWEMLHSRIRQLTERTGRAIRRCSQVVDTAANYRALIEDMERTASRITGQFEHKISFEGGEFLESYNSPTQIDIFLFYKECLVNIYRHSHATKFQTTLSATVREIVLTISDNGQGLPEMLNGKVPPSLSRRARLLRGKLTLEDRQEGGTRVILKIPNPKWWKFWNNIPSLRRPIFIQKTQLETP